MSRCLGFFAAAYPGGESSPAAHSSSPVLKMVPFSTYFRPDCSQESPARRTSLCRVRTGKSRGAAGFARISRFWKAVAIRDAIPGPNSLFAGREQGKPSAAPETKRLGGMRGIGGLRERASEGWCAKKIMRSIGVCARGKLRRLAKSRASVKKAGNTGLGKIWPGEGERGEMMGKSLERFG